MHHLFNPALVRTPAAGRWFAARFCVSGVWCLSWLQFSLLRVVVCSAFAAVWLRLWCSQSPSLARSHRLNPAGPCCVAGTPSKSSRPTRRRRPRSRAAAHARRRLPAANRPPQPHWPQPPARNGSPHGEEACGGAGRLRAGDGSRQSLCLWRVLHKNNVVI